MFSIQNLAGDSYVNSIFWAHKKCAELFITLQHEQQYFNNPQLHRYFSVTMTLLSSTYDYCITGAQLINIGLQ
jgi:hypothetical protein